MSKEVTETFNSFCTEVTGAVLCRAPVLADEESSENVRKSKLRAKTEVVHSEHATKINPPNRTAYAEAASNYDRLMALAHGGDHAAFDELIRKHYRTCLKRATLMLQNRNDAEEEVQNACWKSFQRLEQCRGEGSFSAWLGRILDNQCLMRIRDSHQSSFLYLDGPKDSNFCFELVAQRANPEDNLGGQEVVNLIRREIRLIPPLLRNVMFLRDVDRLPMPEVALRLGISVSAAKSRLLRARKELRQRLVKHCGPKGCATLTRKSRCQQAAYVRAG